MLQVQQVRRVLRAPWVGRVRQGPPELLALQEQARAGLLGVLGVACLILLVSISPTTNLWDQLPQFFAGVDTVRTHQFDQSGFADHLHDLRRGLARKLIARQVVEVANFREERLTCSPLVLGRVQLGRTLPESGQVKDMPPVFLLWHHHDGDGQKRKEIEDDEPLQHTVAREKHDGAHRFGERH